MVGTQKCLATEVLSPFKAISIIWETLHGIYTGLTNMASGDERKIGRVHTHTTRMIIS